MKKRNLPAIPRFENEAEEAQWWFDQRDELSKDFVAAANNGTLGEGSVARAARKQRESRTRDTAA